VDMLKTCATTFFMEMKISELLEGVSGEWLHSYDGYGIEVKGVSYDSRDIRTGNIFVCITGANYDSHDHAVEAVKSGAAAIVAEKITESIADVTVPVFLCEDTRKALAFMSAAYFGHPAKKFRTIGITGTKGKTTTSFLVREILERAGHKTGLVGTIEVITGARTIPAKNTTPLSYELQSYFKEMVDSGCEYVVLEVSSQGLMQHRADGFVFDIGVFTNLEPDHIGGNEHKDFDDYAYWKSVLFTQCKTGIFNGDDQHVERMTKNATCKVEKFGLDSSFDYYAKDIEYLSENGKLAMGYKVSGKKELDVITSTPGDFSVYNTLCAVAICSHFGIEDDVIRYVLENEKVKGRVETVPVSEDFRVIVDYAHNAMSLRSILLTLKKYAPKRLVCVFGCGGNRSRDRRFEMGEVSSELADLTVVTSDNPRFEKPEDIIADIITGVTRKDGKYVSVPDRNEAIGYVLKNAQPGDIILVAGKGHEDYQEIEGVKYPMDDCTMIREWKEKLGY